MLSKIPFRIDNFLEASKCARYNKKRNSQCLCGIVVTDLRITSPAHEGSTGGRPSAITTNRTPKCKFDSHLDPSQLPTLKDWRLIIGTSRRFRELGKEAFFSHKIIVMEPDTVDLLRTSQLKPPSVEYQGIMINYITSIIFLERSSQSPSSFLAIPRRITPFPHLLHIGLFLATTTKRGGPSY